MVIDKNILSKDKLTKWLLSAALFLSSFAFSGYARNSDPQQKQIAKTEVVISFTKKSKLAVSYKTVLNSIFNFSDLSKLDPKAVFEFKRLTKIKFDHLSKQNFTHLYSERFFK